MNTHLWRNAALAFCAGALGIGLILHFNAAGPVHSADAAPPVYVTTAAAVARDVPLNIQAVGTVTPFQSVAVKSRVESQVVDVKFRDGDAVRKGDLLFVLDDRAIRTQLDKARAELDRDKAYLEDLKLQYQRNTSLVAGKTISEQVLEASKYAVQAQSALVQADMAAVESLVVQLSYTQITAPIDGRTGTIASTVGNNVKVNDVPLVTINQIQPILVQSSLPQNSFDSVRRAMQAGSVAVTAKIQASDVVAEGVLEYIDNMIDRGTGTYVARARFANADEALWPGMLASVTLTIGQDQNAIVIPEVAVQSSYSGDFVFVIVGDKAQKREVKVGRNIDGMALITTGLEVGEQVVTDGMLSLSEGSTVSVRPAGSGSAP
jgi:multidrug efflux system membrane fusion protein